MISIKPGVRARGINPEMVLALMVVGSILEAGGVDLVITSIIDGVHSRGSLHYVGNAVDIRSRDMGDMEGGLAEDCRQALGMDYDLVQEGNHWHIEFQPKEHY